MLAVDIGALERQIDETDGDAVLPDRHLPRQQRRARRRLQHRERFAHAEARRVDLVHEQEMRDAQLLELAQRELQREDLARIGLAHDDRRVDERQHVARFMGEFHRSRKIDEGVLVAEIVGVADVGLDAHLMRARLRAGVADARALARGSGPFEQGLE